LLEYAKGVIPANKHSSTPLYLLATAGMRLVPKNEQIVLFENICKFVSNAEQYAFSIHGGCDYHFRIISGELEGNYY
jgi:golgi apyrase